MSPTNVYQYRTCDACGGVPESADEPGVICAWCNGTGRREYLVPAASLHHRRVSLSIPSDLAAWVRETAERDGVTVSAVVEAAVSAHRERTRLTEPSR